MKLERFSVELSATDNADRVENCIVVEAHDGADLLLTFPNRTPLRKLNAVADAINNALKAAGELEGLGRD